MITTIYRTGKMSVADHDDDIAQHWGEFDVRSPDGHVMRQDALFAAPDIQGAHHWLYNISLTNPETLVFNEITVESDNVMVYNVEEYNSVSHHGGDPSYGDIFHIESYWLSGMTLTEWMQKVREDAHGQWEVLLSENEVISHRSLTYREMRALYIEYGMEDERLTELDEDLSIAIDTAEELVAA